MSCSRRVVEDTPTCPSSEMDCGGMNQLVSWIIIFLKGKAWIQEFEYKVTPISTWIRCMEKLHLNHIFKGAKVHQEIVLMECFMHFLKVCVFNNTSSFS